MLQRSREIDLQVVVWNSKTPRSLCTVLAGNVKLVFDVHDSSRFYTEDLEECDYYFKRSYCPAIVAKSGFAHKIQRYGLNYHVVPDFINRFFINKEYRFYGIKGLFKYLIKRIDFPCYFHFEPAVSAVEQVPGRVAPGKILFMARVWDHEYDADFEMTPEYSEERLVLNEVRAGCIRGLRREFGNAFTGGLEHSAYAKKQFRDCLTNIPAMTSKKNYLELVKDHAICVSTVGLNQSIGWKFGEYVALSRAILSEELAFQIPGGFCVNENYLEFTSVDQCVEQAVRLMENPALVAEMMQQNHEYYRKNLRPDALVRNCLYTALH